MDLKNKLAANPKGIVETVKNEAVLTEFRKLPEFVELENFINKTSEIDITLNELDSFIKNNSYLNILKNPKLKDIDLGKTWLFPVTIKTTNRTNSSNDFGTYILNVMWAKIDWQKVKINMINQEWQNFISISPVKLNIKAAMVDSTNLKIPVADDVKKELDLIINWDADFFTNNDVHLKNILIMDYVELMEWTTIVDSLGFDEKGEAIILNKQNFDHFLSVTPINR